MKEFSVISNAEIKQEVVDTKKAAKNFTLEDIEDKMVELASNDSKDVVEVMLNEKKISMLEKVANLKIKRLQLQELLKEQTVVEEVKPIQVQFISAKTTDQTNRIERIDNDILSKKVNSQDA